MTGLQVLYEKYFLGIDRRPPDAQRRQVSEKMRLLKTTQVRNTALKFRIQTMFAKLISFERMWDRTLREIEEGTYKRDVFKAKLRDARRGAGQKPAEAAPSPSSPQLSDQMIRKLYDTIWSRVSAPESRPADSTTMRSPAASAHKCPS